MSYHGSKHNSKDNLSVMIPFQVLEYSMMQIFPLWFFIKRIVFICVSIMFPLFNAWTVNSNNSVTNVLWLMAVYPWSQNKCLYLSHYSGIKGTCYSMYAVVMVS